MAVGTKGPRQFQGLFDVIPFTATVDPASAGDDAESEVDITVAGAEIGDFVLFASGVDTQDVNVSAQVTAANTVTVVYTNVGGSTRDLASSTCKGVILKPKDNVFAEL